MIATELLCLEDAYRLNERYGIEFSINDGSVRVEIDGEAD